MRARRRDGDRWRPIRLDQGTRKDRPREHAARLVALLILASPTDSEGFRRCRPDANATRPMSDRYRTTIGARRECRVNKPGTGFALYHVRVSDWTAGYLGVMFRTSHPTPETAAARRAIDSLPNAFSSLRSVIPAALYVSSVSHPAGPSLPGAWMHCLP
jgi:hypothetical protein